MKKIKRKSMIALTLSAISLTLCTLPFLTSKKSTSALADTKEWTYKDCQSIIKFIDDNLETFVTEYNKTVEEDNYLNATKIEYSTIIHIIEDDNYGAYIDFNGDNGYVVVTGNYTIYDLKVSGDLDYLRNETNILFSKIDGFLYLGEDGYPVKYESKKPKKAYSPYINQQNALSDSTNTANENKIEDGEIKRNKLEEHVSKYYPDFKFVGEFYNTDSNFKYTLQKTTAYYKMVNKNGLLRKGEGNCTLTAAYSCLKYWAVNSYIRSLSNIILDVSHNITNDKNYSKYGTGETKEYINNEECSWVTNDKSYLENMPDVYSEIYEYAVQNYNYTPESGLEFRYMREILRHFSITRNKNLYINSTQSVTAIFNFLEEKKVCALGINGSSTYEDHAVVMLGYRTYQAESGWWIFKKIYQRVFYQIADGWNSESVYFDPHIAKTYEVFYCLEDRT